MLKVKKTIYNPSNKTKDQVSQLQNDIKNSIKKNTFQQPKNRQNH